jgi:hypothetical protein
MATLSVEEQTANRRAARELAQTLSSTLFTRSQLVTSNYAQDGANFSLTSSNGLAGTDLYNAVKEYFPHAQGDVAEKSVTINYTDLLKDMQQYQRGLDAISQIRSQSDFGSAIVKKAMEDVSNSLRFSAGTKATASYFNDSGVKRATLSAVVADGNIDATKVAMNNYKGIDEKIINRVSELLEQAGLPKDAINYKPSVKMENASELNSKYNIIATEVRSNGVFDGLKISIDTSFTVNPDFEISPAQIKKVQELTASRSPNAEAVTVASVVGLKGINKNLSDIEFLAAALKEHCRQEGYPNCKTFISNDREGNSTKVNIDIPKEYLDKVPASFAYTSKSDQLSSQLIRSFGESHLNRIKDSKGESKVDAYGVHLKLNSALSESDKDIISRAANKSFSLGV